MNIPFRDPSGNSKHANLDADGNLRTTGATGSSSLASEVVVAHRADRFQATVSGADLTAATQVKAKTASKSIYITDIIISTDTAMNIQLQDDAGSPIPLVEQMYFPANSILCKSFITPLKVAENQDLDVVASVAGNVSVTVLGYVV